jgi:hypothetical protein
MQTVEQSSVDTRDVYLASFRRARGYELAEVRREGSRCVFHFRDRADRRAAMDEFYRGEGAISALSLVEAIRQMKSIIHAGA